VKYVSGELSYVIGGHRYVPGIQRYFSGDMRSFSGNQRYMPGGVRCVEWSRWAGMRAWGQGIATRGQPFAFGCQPSDIAQAFRRSSTMKRCLCSHTIAGHGTPPRNRRGKPCSDTLCQPYCENLLSCDVPIQFTHLSWDHPFFNESFQCVIP
jgi:hypothetical protein